METPDRHPGEVRFALIGTILALTALPLFAYLFASYDVPGMAIFVVVVIAAVYIGRGVVNAKERVTSVEITSEQFPEVHSRIEHYAAEFGLEATPRAYLVQEGGILNAFASKHNRTNFIRINADIFEVGTFDAAIRPRDAASLDFIIAHEIGHVAAKHTTYWYSWLSSFIGFIPFIGAALSRSKEYTADNYAFSAVPGGTNGIVLLSGGKYLYPLVDGELIAARATTDRGLFLWFYNAFATHPVQTKRLAALYDRSRPGKLF
jgi:Zn-dependent protease with chaperone function